MALIRPKKIEPIDFRQAGFARSAAQSFPFEDQEILLQALIKNFEIHATIQKINGCFALIIYSVFIRSAFCRFDSHPSVL